MMKNTKRIFRWWWGWNPEKIERWLEEQESLGWNLVEISHAGLLFRFEKGPARKMACRIDYQNHPGYDPEYLELFKDSGWTLIHCTLGWYFWQKGYDDVKPEIFTDTESLIERNNRQMKLLGIITFAQVPGIISLSSAALKSNLAGFYRIWLPFHLALIGVLVFILISFLRHNRRLKESGKKPV